MQESENVGLLTYYVLYYKTKFIVNAAMPLISQFGDIGNPPNTFGPK